MHCLPIFIGKPFVLDGRPPSNPSATATLVKFKNRLWVVTCDHVRVTAESNPEWVASLAAGNVTLELGCWGEGGWRSALKKVDCFESGVDIAIAEIPNHSLETLSRSKPKAPIDLDEFIEPNWASVKQCIAVGFPDRMKKSRVETSILESPMVEAVADLCDLPGPSAKYVTLHSELHRPARFALSGISGGAIFAICDDTILPAAITFEGHPSGPLLDPIASPSWLKPEDLFVRGLLLRPTYFSDWLAARCQS